MSIFFLPGFLIGQNIRMYTLLDYNSKEPVSYASISTGISSSLIYSDINGNFSVEELPNLEFDISRLGYKSVSISGANFPDTILMYPEAFVLSEIAIIANTTNFEVGYNFFKTCGTAEMNSQMALGVLIENPDRTSRIVNVLVDTKNNQKGDMYQIDFFEVSQNGDPQHLYFSQKFTSLSGQNKIKINVANANLTIPNNGVLVSISWKGNLKEIEDERETILLKITRDLKESYSYIFTQNIWGKLETPQFDYSLNYKIGLELISE